MPVLPRLNDYDDIYRQFRWQVPARYNIGVDVCDRWALSEPDRLAILHVQPDGREETISYGWLARHLQPARQCVARAWR